MHQAICNQASLTRLPMTHIRTAEVKSMDIKHTAILLQGKGFPEPTP